MTEPSEFSPYVDSVVNSASGRHQNAMRSLRAADEREARHRAQITIRPEEIWEDRAGRWWCEVNGTLYISTFTYGTRWGRPPSYAHITSWDVLNVEAGPLWRVPDPIDVSLPPVHMPLPGDDIQEGEAA